MIHRCERCGVEIEGYPAYFERKKLCQDCFSKLSQKKARGDLRRKKYRDEKLSGLARGRKERLEVLRNET